MRRFFASIAVGLAFLLAGMPAKAGLITFEYKNTVDFTAFGGGASEALSLKWTFDDGLTDKRGGDDDVGIFGSITGSIQVGGFSLSLNNLSTRDIRINDEDDDDGDRYQVRFAGSDFAFGNQTTDRIRLRFDGPASMFSSDALPTNTTFFSSVTSQRFIVDLSAGNRKLALLGPGTLTAVPVAVTEPATLALFSLGLLLLGFVARRRTAKAAFARA